MGVDQTNHNNFTFGCCACAVSSWLIQLYCRVMVLEKTAFCLVIWD
jgi:hypothetical protein